MTMDVAVAEGSTGMVKPIMALQEETFLTEVDLVNFDSWDEKVIDSIILLILCTTFMAAG